MPTNNEIMNIILKTRYFRLKDRADRTKRKYEREMNEHFLAEIKHRHYNGQPNNRIACQLGLTKEYVDAVITSLY